MITLIEDTGIQFITQSFEIEKNSLRTQYFVQNRRKNLLTDEYDTTIEQGEKVDGEVFTKKSLVDNGCYTEDGRVDTHRINWNLIEHYNEDDTIESDDNPDDFIKRVLKINDLRECLELFEDKWLPCPFFKYQYNGETLDYSFGPIAWGRMKVLLPSAPTTENQEEDEILRFNIVFAFDTMTSSGSSDNSLLLVSSKNRRFYKIPEGDVELLNFTSKYDWIKDTIKAKSNSKKSPKQAPLLHIAKYLYMVSNLAKSETTPKVEVFPNKNDENIIVDFVLDIGNSRTCGLIFESTDESNVEFDRLEKLKLLDLENPFNFTQDPFDMRLVVAEEKFGDITIPEYSEIFNWPSIVRLGGQASALLNKYDIANHSRNETLNTMSSPKRYLWDTNPSKDPWEYIKSKEEYAKSPARREVSYKYFTQHLTIDGKFSKELTQNSRAFYSRSAMMVFVVVEILLHLYTQINSDEYRNNKGRISKARRLRNIIITCPTAMAKAEQLKMKESVENAIKLLHNFYVKIDEEVERNKPQSSGFNFSDFTQDLPSLHEDETATGKKTVWSNIGVIPSSNDIKLGDSDYEEKQNWIYDEATTSQMVFIYGQLVVKYNNDFEKYFDVYGKSRDGEKTLTVASLDIGGGTTDFMICQYAINSINTSTLTPDPLFWETFNVAGDEIIRMIIQQILLDGEEDGKEFDAEVGILKYYALQNEVEDVTSKIVFFFGEHFKSNQHIIYKQAVVNQLLVPVVLKYLSFLTESVHLDKKTFSFEDIFSDMYPNPDVIKYLNEHFGGKFNFEEIKWTASRSKLNKVIDICFSKLLRQISIISSALEVDLILLSGRPSAIPHIRNMLINYMPSTPDRVISISNFNIGTWCPTSIKGTLKDAKTTVATGAMLYLLGGKQIGDLGVTIDTRLLKKKLVSTANNIGKYDSYQNGVPDILLKESQEKVTIRVDKFPFDLGVKQLKHHTYPARKLYTIAKNRDYEKARLKKHGKYQHMDDSDLINIVERRFGNVYDVELSRNLKNSKEQLEISKIINRENGEDMDTRHLKLILVTLDDEKGYWLDQGVFIGLNTSPVN